jgi:outer membrane protein OmpA-like peptidoglycan-associated protein/tetratricopeptide (TPR) repeat protein
MNQTINKKKDMQLKSQHRILFLTILILICSVNNSISQDYSRKVLRAREAFNNKAYYEAVKKYETINNKRSLPVDEKERFALALLKTDNSLKAEEIYASIGIQSLNTDHLYYYAQVLKYNGKYKNADSIITCYLERNPNDSRALEQKNATSLLDQMLRNKRAIVEEADFNSKQSDFSPIVNNGVMYFASSREINPAIKRRTARNNAPFLNVFRAEKSDEKFVNPKLFTSHFKTMYHDGPICFNRTGTEIFITRNRHHSFFYRKDKKGFNRLYIVQATRLPNGSWSPPSELPFNSKEYSCGHPFLSGDGKRLYFTSDRPDGYGGTDIFYVDRNGNGWGNPVNMGNEINTEGDEMFPSADENGHFYFASNGHLGLGGLDIFVAQMIDGKYQVKNIGFPINSMKDDFSFFLQPDSIHGFFASNRPGGSGDDDIYKFQLTSPVVFKEPPKTYKGIVLNKETGETIPGAIIGILDSIGTYTGEVTANKTGLFQLPDTLSGIYTAMAAIKFFYPYEKTIHLKNIQDTIVLAISPKPEYGIIGKITPPGSNTPIPGVEIRAYSPSLETDTFYTNSNGIFKVRLEPYSDYKIIFHKRNFFPQRLTYSTNGLKPGYVNINNGVPIPMGAVKRGIIAGVSVSFNLDQLNRAPEAVNGLEDLTFFLKENPNIKIEIGCHTDSRGEAEDNLKLSQKRADILKEYLIENGITPSQMESKGYGETRLKNNCADGIPCTEQQHRENERTEITILDM